jgi:deoxyguanosine kinase
VAIVAIDGPTGVGKSTTSQAIAERLGTAVLLDPVSVSPLLDGYYNGEAAPSAHLGSELAFLRGRYGILAAAPPDQLVVADFTVMRTAPFAEFLHDPDDRDIVISEMWQFIEAGPTIDVLVLLDAQPQTLFQRVRSRDRDAETELTLGHLVELRRHFAAWRPEFVAHARSTTEIDTTTWDPRRTSDVDMLLDRIAQLQATTPES